MRQKYTHTLLLLILAVLSLALLSTACRDAPATPPEAADPPRHVVLITLDTLRADHLGIYGSDVDTPRLDQLATQGAFAEHASAHVPLTRPSHVSLMSGRLPTETGVRDNVSPAAIPNVPLLAEVLEGAGFETAAFVSSIVVSRASGLDRGFAIYDDKIDADPTDPRLLSSAQKRGDETVAEAVAWLEDRTESAEWNADPPARLFMWLHLFDPHDPYEAPEPHGSRYADRPYAGEVAWTDELVGRLDDALTRLGLGKDTLLIVTADHGEGLGDHDELLHGFFVYESTLRVPLLFRGPGIKPGGKLQVPVGLVDLYPTVLDFLKILPPTGTELSGRSLASALRGGEEGEVVPIYAESLVPRLRFGWSDLRVVRDGDFKYIRAPRPEIYEVSTDPGERSNRVESERPRVRQLDAVLDSFLAREQATSASDTPSPNNLSPELLAKLNALGYLGGTAPASTASPDADPKDKIEDFRIANDLMRQGLMHLHGGDLHGGDLQAAIEKFEELLERGIDSAELHLYLGRAHLGLGHYRAAAERFAEATSRGAQHLDAWLGLAEAHIQMGDTETALAALRSAQTSLPEEAGLRKEEGRLLGYLGRMPEAQQAFESALPLAPGDAELRAMLSEVLRNLGNVETSAQRLREAVEIEPDEPKYWNALGMTLGGLERLAEAETAFREACRLDDNNHRYIYNLGLVLKRMGREEEARPLFEQAMELRPDETDQ